MTRRKPQVWALTGPIAAGKSTASKILKSQGAVVVDGDSLGHELLQRQAIQEAIVAEIGAECVDNGIVDRRRLGAKVFAETEAMAKLNRIMHGPLGALATEKLEELSASGHHELAVFEAAVYFLLPTPPKVDLVLVVTADEDLRKERLVARGLTATEARRRIAAQVALQPAWKSAEHILRNNGGSDELEAQLLSFWTDHIGESSFRK